MKIREYIILLTDKQDKRLVEMAEAAGYDDDLSYLQLRIDALLNEDERLEHTEK